MVRYCTEHPDDPNALCERCGFCEEMFYACSEDEEMEESL